MNEQQRKPDLSRLRIDRSGAKPGRSGGRRTVFVVGGIVLLAVIGFWAIGPMSGEDGIPVTTAVATIRSSGGGTGLLTASGYVVAQRQAAVSSKATGRLVYLAVEEGDRVKKGQLLGRVESEDVEAALDQARANQRVAEGQHGTAQARLREARLTYERVRGLIDRELASQAEYDNAEAALAIAVADSAAAVAAIESARAAVRAAEVAVENTRIRAPFDGTVLTKTADVGEMVAPFASSQSSRGAVVTLADMGSLEVEADVSESNIQRVSPGAPAEIILDAYPAHTYAGRVKKIVPTADRAKATVLTKVDFVDIDERVLPEMSAKVTFLEAGSEVVSGSGKLTVPAGAVVGDDQTPAVYLVQDGAAVYREVRAGAVEAGGRVIYDGLQAGDIVVVDPPENLTDGAAVSPR